MYKSNKKTKQKHRSKVITISHDQVLANPRQR